ARTKGTSTGRSQDSASPTAMMVRISRHTVCRLRSVCSEMGCVIADSWGGEVSLLLCLGLPVGEGWFYSGPRSRAKMLHLPASWLGSTDRVASPDSLAKLLHLPASWQGSGSVPGGSGRAGAARPVAPVFNLSYIGRAIALWRR